MPKGNEEEPPPAPDNDAFLAWLAAVPEPDRRYTIATSKLEEYQELVSRLSALRASAVADASAADSVTSVARRFGVSRQRAHQLLREAKAKKAAVQAPAARRRWANQSPEGEEL